MIAAVNLMINIYIHFSNKILLLLIKNLVFWLVFLSLTLTISFSDEFVVCAISADCAYSVQYGMSLNLFQISKFLSKNGMIVV
jgi:hypothetical protein